MTDKTPEPPHPQLSLDRLIADLLRAVFEVFRPLSMSSPALAARLREEHEAAQAAEAEIQRRYAGAIWKSDELERRAKAYGVVFAPALRAEYRAAILDFLDNPDAPTPLTGMHMTWFWGADQHGRATSSRTHPVNRAVYRFNARDFATMRPYGHPQSDAALHRLRTVHYPLERCDWTAAQWAAYEESGREAMPAQVSRPRNLPRSPGSGIPNAL